MKTIAISIDEDTLQAIDTLVERSPDPKASRSQLVRTALTEYLERREKAEREERERRILASHRDLLARQAAALVAEQAEP